MGLVIAIYTKEAFKEYIFPAINNADYSLTLGKNTFNLRKDISLEFEVINDVWKFLTEFFCQENDTNCFVEQDLLQFFTKFVTFMDNNTIYAGKTHAGIGVDVVTD